MLTFSVAYQIQVILDCPTLCSTIPFKMYQNIKHNLQSVYTVYNQWAWIQSLTLYFRDKGRNLQIPFPHFCSCEATLLHFLVKWWEKLPCFIQLGKISAYKRMNICNRLFKKKAIDSKSLVLLDLFQHFSNFCYSNFTTSSVILKHGN